MAKRGSDIPRDPTGPTNRDSLFRDIRWLSGELAKHGVNLRNLQNTAKVLAKGSKNASIVELAAAKEELIAQGAKLERRDAELRQQSEKRISFIRGGNRLMLALTFVNLLVAGGNLIHEKNRRAAAAAKARQPAVSAPLSPTGSREAPEEPQIQTLTDNNFERLTARGIWVIDVWAEWCPPCMEARPHFEELLRWYGDQVSLGSYDYGPRDSEQDRKLIDRFGAPNRGIPQFIIVRNGSTESVIVGFDGPEDFHEDIHRVLSPFGVEIQRR